MSDRAAVRPPTVPDPAPPRSRRAWAAGLAVAALALPLAGCGGTSSTSAPATTAAGTGSPTTTSATPGTAAPGVTAAPGTTTPVGAVAPGGTAAPGATTTVPTPLPTSAPSPPTTIAPSPPTTSSITPTAGGSFCGFAQSQVAKALSAVASVGTDPTDLRQIAARFAAFEGTLLAATPAAIKPAMSGLLGFDSKLFALLAQDDYNFSRISPSAITALEQDEAQESQDARTVTAYIERSCGIHLPS